MVSVYEPVKNYNKTKIETLYWKMLPAFDA